MPTQDDQIQRPAESAGEIRIGLSVLGRLRAAAAAMLSGLGRCASWLLIFPACVGAVGRALGRCLYRWTGSPWTRFRAWRSRKLAGPDGEFEGGERDLRVASRKFIRSALGGDGAVLWIWVAMLGGSCKRGLARVMLLRFAIVFTGGLLIAAGLYAALEWYGVRPLVASLEKTREVMNLRYEKVQAAMKADFPNDASRLATVRFDFKTYGGDGGFLQALVSTPVKGEKDKFSDEIAILLNIKPLLPPFYHIETNLSGQALTRALITTSTDGRGDEANPSEKAINHYEYLLRHIGDRKESFEQPLLDLVALPEYTWSRRFSGFIQAGAFVVFGCFLVSILIRSLADYGFDRWLWRRSGRVGLRRIAMADYYALSPQGMDACEMRNHFQRVDAAVQEIQERVQFQGYVLDSPSLHVRSEAAAALCEAGPQRISAARALIESAARAHGEKYYASTGLSRFLLWCLPSLGIVGTAIGIGDALGYTNLLQSLSLFEREAGRSTVSTAIAVAFDSTFTGLVLSIIGMWILHLVHQRQDGYAQEVASEVAAAITTSKLFDDTRNASPALTLEDGSRLPSTSRPLRARLAVWGAVSLAGAMLYFYGSPQRARPVWRGLPAGKAGAQVEYLTDARR